MGMFVPGNTFFFVLYLFVDYLCDVSVVNRAETCCT